MTSVAHWIQAVDAVYSEYEAKAKRVKRTMRKSSSFWRRGAPMVAASLVECVVPFLSEARSGRGWF